MTKATLKQLDEAQKQADVARKRLEEAIENYASARVLHVDALRTHNEKG
jgi:hypothetical protein